MYVKQSGFLFLIILAWTSVFHVASQPASSVFKENQDFEPSDGLSSDASRISAYYEFLWNRQDKERSERAQNKSESQMVKALAIHRGLGKHHDRTEQYRIIDEAFLGSLKHCKLENKCQVMDAGCGTGSAMLYFRNFGWNIQGYTLAVNQWKYIKANYPDFQVALSSYDQIPDDTIYDGIYAIETLWYSDWRQTLKVWANHLEYGSRIAIIDDFAVNQSSAESDPNIQGYVKGWRLKNITAVDELCAFAELETSLKCIKRRNLTEEFNVNKYNYGNHEPNGENKNYKTYRYKSSIKGTLLYTLVCLEKV